MHHGLLGGYLYLDRVGAPAPGLDVAAVVALPSEVFGDTELAYLERAVPNDAIDAAGSRIDDLDVKLPPTTTQVESVGGDWARLSAVYGTGVVFIQPAVTVQDDRLTLNLQLAKGDQDVL